MERASIDFDLAAGTRTHTEVARELGISRQAVDAHFKRHTPTMVRIYARSADLPRLGELHGEYLRLYTAALDNLALAQAGTLTSYDGGKTYRRKVSVTSTARAIEAARKNLDKITQLAADASSEHERPSGVDYSAMTHRMEEALARIERGRSLEGQAQVDVEAEADPPGEPTPGGLVGLPGALAPSQVPLDAAMAPKALSPLSESVQQVIAADRRTTTPQRSDDQVVLTMKNPRYPGSPAATSEERAAAGFPDIEITLQQLKTNAEIVAEIIAERQSPPPEEGTPR